MILSRTEVGDSTAMEFFSEGEIGDKDGDGMPEIWDAWKNPVRFVRWPVGFLINSPFVDVNERDPLDPTRAFFGDSRAGNNGESYVNVPLVVSAGKDAIFDLALSNASGFLFYGSTAGNKIPNDPWVQLNNSVLMCSINVDGDGTNNAADNIYSHVIETSIK